MERMLTFDQFIAERVEQDPENEGCYTLRDFECFYEEYKLDYELEHKD